MNTTRRTGMASKEPMLLSEVAAAVLDETKAYCQPGCATNRLHRAGYPGIMRCSCYRGRNIIRKSGGRDVPLERFDELKDYRVIDPTWGESTVAHFGRWCEERKEQAFQERMASYQWTPETSRHSQEALV
jgi:hypothetical protein